MKRRACVAMVLLTLGVTTGCASESSPRDEVPGETAPTLQGIVMEAPDASEGVEVAVLWSYYPSIAGEGSPTVIPGERVTVHGEFPAAFTLGALSPPPDFVLQGSVMLAEDPTESRVAQGTVFTVRPGANYENVSIEDLIGSDRVHSIAYVETDIEEGSYGEYLVGPLQAGFHLLESRGLRDCETDDGPNWHEFADGTASCNGRIWRASMLGFATPIVVEGPISVTNDAGETFLVPYFESW